jgi:hypothetical protein
MRDFSYQRCLNHAEREAVARCPGCGQFFCRECVTEHEDQVLCAVCLRNAGRPRLLRRGGVPVITRVAQGLAGLVVAWFFFYLVGEALLALPASFHEGTLWQADSADK